MNLNEIKRLQESHQYELGLYNANLSLLGLQKDLLGVNVQKERNKIELFNTVANTATNLLRLMPLGGK